MKARMMLLVVLGMLLMAAQAWAGDYTPHGDGTVTDNATGLMWQQDGSAIRNWEGALSYCQEGGWANHTDWRLPNIKELESIVDDTIPYPWPTIDAVAFPNTPSSWYWSSTTYADDPDYAWGVYFYDGSVDGDGKDGDGYVRCVRGGQ